MTTIGLIGSGSIGGTVARLAVDAGYDVVLSNSRGPATLRDLVAQLGARASAGTREQAAAAGSLVLVSVPIKAYASLSDIDLSGRIVMDTGNYYPQRDGEIDELADKSLTDSAYLARFVPGAQVVKVFNNIFFKHLLSLARPTGAADRTALPIAGDASDAKAAVTEFLDRIGYDAVDAGLLGDGWRQQPGTPVYGAPYGTFEDPMGTPASVAVIKRALEGATR